MILTGRRKFVKRLLALSFFAFAHPKDDRAIGIEEFLYFHAFRFGKAGVEFAEENVFIDMIWHGQMVPCGSRKEKIGAS